MTTLLIDLGNTALKWTPIEEPDNPHTIIHKGSTHFKEELYDLWLNMRPKRIIGCTVAAPVVAFSLTKFFNDHGIRWNWVRTQPSFHGRMTLNNCYENPGQLGADRWYAAVGAADAMLEERRSLLVVHTGTATTVDSILYRESGVYDFRGGLITLGPTLMKTFLTKGIPSLTDLDGAYDALPLHARRRHDGHHRCAGGAHPACAQRHEETGLRSQGAACRRVRQVHRTLSAGGGA